MVESYLDLCDLIRAAIATGNDPKGDYVEDLIDQQTKLWHQLTPNQQNQVRSVLSSNKETPARDIIRAMIGPEKSKEYGI